LADRKRRDKERVHKNKNDASKNKRNIETNKDKSKNYMTIIETPTTKVKAKVVSQKEDEQKDSAKKYAIEAIDLKMKKTCILEIICKI
jgi:hypothetical protein